MDYAQLTEARGISLASLGLIEVALTTSDALLAVEMLAQSGVPILGGDVYFARGARIEQAYANWFTEPRPGETSVVDSQQHSPLERRISQQHSPGMS